MSAPPAGPTTIARGTVRIDQLSVTFATPNGPKTVLRDIDLEVAAGEFVCIVGPSGAGKTTLIRCVSGLNQPTSGSVLLDGEVIDGPPSPLALVSQDYSRSLMPWLRVEDNVRLPLRGKGIEKAEVRRRVDEALASVGLAGSARAYPWQLSGGMQQRVSIARALAYAPEVLVMDEPFASVDAQTRADLEDLILKLQRSTGLTVILVTHDIDESVYLADRVIVLGGTPATVQRELAIPLGRNRDQLSTKLLPEFAELRAEVLTHIRDAHGGAQ
jgi:NitT/TauT family transport system ATP-binding protein